MVRTEPEIFILTFIIHHPEVAARLAVVVITTERQAQFYVPVRITTNSNLIWIYSLG